MRSRFAPLPKLLRATAGLGLAISLTSHVRADQEDVQTAVTGSVEADTITVSSDASVLASVETSSGEALKASATGVDAQGGGDAVTSDAGVATTATATALLTEQPGKTGVEATATGISAGEGDDTVTGSAVFTSLASALGAFAGALEYQQPADGTPPTELDFSITAQATAAGFLTGAGADTLANTGLFTITALGTSGGTADRLDSTVRDAMSVKVASTAEATATGMESGAGGDSVTNDGVMVNSATATAGALALGLVAPQGTAAPDPQDPGAPPATKKTQISTEANAKATAEAVGIDGEEDETEDSSEDTSPFGLDGLRVTYERTVSAVSGDDTLANSVFLTNLATATSGAGSAAVSNEVDGTVKSSATSEASAEGAGLAAGGGNDAVTNSGELLSAATATAGALSVSLVAGTPSGPAPAPAAGEAPKPPAPSADKENKAGSTTNVTATARATGIDAEGEGQVQTTTGSAEISDGTLVVAFERTVSSAAGNDVVVNSGAVQALGTATAASQNASVVVSSGGSTDAESKSTGASYGAAIATGAGDDDVRNTGVLTSVATTNASAITLGLAVGKAQETTPPADGGTQSPPAAPSKLATSTKTGVEATADAFGVDAEGRAITTTTTGQLSIDSSSLSLDVSRTETGASGADTVTNDGVITATATADADSTDAAIGLQTAGSVNSEAEAQAKAASTGIYTGAGNDTITNNVLLAAVSSATADSLSIGLTVAKPPEQAPAGGTPPDPAPKPDKSTAKVNAGATAEATATAIDADGSRHDKSLSGSLDIDANTLAIQLNRIESSLTGDDAVTNRGVLDADAVATSGALAGGIIVNAAGSVDADARSRARATSGGILTGAGADTVDNTLLVQSEADATATALALAVTVTQPTDGTGTKPSTLDKLKGLFATANSVADAEATTRATGIDTEGEAHQRTQTISIGNGGDGRLATYVDDTSSLAGADSVTNSGAVVVAADTLAGAGAAEIKVQAEGTASATADARANATAGAVTTGGAGDSVTNSGALDATANATAGALALTFTQDDGPGSKGRSNARATSDASATGIATDAATEARHTEASLSLADGGIVLAVSDSTTAGEGADSVSNQGQVDAEATATSGAAGVAIAIDGSASSDVDAVARARAGGVDAGGGADVIGNEGGVTATATATSGALGIAFGQKGTEKSKSTEKVEASSTADSSATGISGDSGRNTANEATLAISLDGVSATWESESEAVTGDDTITSEGSVAATATSTSGTVGASIAMDGVAKADIKATANSRAVAIDGGGGNDGVTSEGGLTSTATATAGAVAATIGAKTSADSSARTKVDAGTVAEAVAAGISADGASRSETSSASVDIDGDGLTVGYSKVTTAASGDDAIDNRQAVTTTATASSGTIAAAVSIKGAAHAVADSAATADSRALETGGGADSVINSGTLTADADATAATLNAAISTEGRAVSNAGLMGGGTSATSRAAGISTAGSAGPTSTGITGFIDFNDIGVEARYETISDGIAADGNDTVNNSGAVTVTSDALAPRLDAAITGKGVAVSLGRATADSYGGGIDTGHLDDSIDNSGALDVTATAEAVLANVAVTGKGLAVAANSVWDGGTEAGAVATGINADSGGRTTTVVDVDAEADTLLARVRYNKDYQAAAGDDTIVNSGAITTFAEAAAPSLNVAVVAGTGLAAAVSTATATADSTAVRGGDGDDGVDNEGVLDAAATATAAAANVAVTNQGVAIAADAVWDGGTKANAAATGIAGDGGNRSSSTYLAVGTDETTFESTSVLADGADTITNRGAITAESDATALSAGVAVALTGVGAATATSTATSRAAAIDAGAGTAVDTVGNSGALTADAEATAAAASVSVTNSGVALSSDSVWDGGTKADARARGIDIGAGAETVTNDGAVDATATSTTLSAAVAVTISGVAGATATATGEADATAIDASAGNDADTVNNTGDLTATADALAASAAVSVVNTGLAIAADAVWDGGTGAGSRARGIDVGEGADTVDNSGAIDATSEATAASLGVSVAVSGVAGAVSTSTATADAAAIDAGADAAVDTVTNDGNLTASSTATANTATVSITTAGVAVAADAVWDGGTGADATARGISAGLGSDTIGNTGNLEATADAVTRSAAVSVALTGVAGAISSSTSTAGAVALDAGDGEGDDQVTNSGDLAATATGEAASAAVSFTAAGVAVSGGSVWDGGTRSTSRASGIGLGAGADELVNEGELTADSTARATGISVSVAVEGVAGAITAATADAGATGIDAGAGDDDVRSTRQITSGALANANTVSAAGTKFGVSVAGNGTWEGGTSGTAAASGISGGAGLDVIDNSGAIDSTATVVAPSTAVAFTVGGVAASVSTATADADASAIDGGDDGDDIDNTGVLIVTADGSAVAVNVALTGIGAGVAADSVWDGGTTSRAMAGGIRGGAGNDDISNTTAGAGINATANATATSVAASVTVGGFAGSVSTSTAIAGAAAIDAGDGDDVVLNEASVTGKADARGTSVSVSVVGTGGAAAGDSFWDGGTKADATAAGIAGGGGADDLTNAGDVTADAESHTTSAAVAAGLAPGGGFAAAFAASTSTAAATALQAGAGDDFLTNDGALASLADADAEGVSVAFQPFGAVIAGAFVDAATRAEALATGMAGADGVDTVSNSAGATIVLDSGAATRDTAVALTLAGFAAAEANAISAANGIGLDGGAEADTLRNLGTITGTVDSRAVARGIAIAGLGAGLAAANSTGRADGAGLAGGAGDDLLDNAGSVDLTLDATALGQAISGSLAGASISDASADAIAAAAGQRGDEGADTITNSGTVLIDAGAATTARSISATALGAALGVANSTATSEAAGLAGGDGGDTITNEADGEVDVLATADVTSSSVTIVVAGAADGEARAVTSVAATGLAGDAGDDAIGNAGLVTVLGLSRSSATGGSATVAGSASARAGTEVETTATGMAGGDGADSIVNSGTVRVGPGQGDDPWMSRLSTGSLSIGFAGDMEAQSAAFARTTSIGLDGGDEADDLSNTGDLSVAATARSDTGTGALSIFGSSAGGGESGAFTRATGLGGGAGDDRLETLGALAVTAESLLGQTGTSFTFGGSGSTGAVLEAGTEAFGLAGGDGADEITAAGVITVDAGSRLSSSGGGDTAFGSSTATGTSGATTRATGIDGGAGDDLIDSAATMMLTATSDLSLDNATYTFGGSGSTGGTLAAATTADGIQGGDGADRIHNSGAIGIEALSTLSTRGGSETTFGGSSSSSNSGGRATARGLAGGEGDDVIENRAGGSLDVDATTEVSSNAVAYTFLGGGSASDAALTGDATATGMAGDAGADNLVNRGEIRVLADAALTARGGAKTSITGLGDPESSGVAAVAAVATGMAGGDGADQMESSNLLEVEAVGVAEASNEASTNGFSIVNGNEAGAVTRADVAATGLEGGEGPNGFDIGGDVAVTARGTAYALAVSSGAVISLGSDGQSRASSTAAARATGVTAGDGDDDVDSDGRVTVTANAATAKRLLVDITVYRDIRSTDEGDQPPAPATYTDAALPAFYDGDGDPIQANRDAYPDGTVVFWTASPPEAQEPNNALDVDGGHYLVNVETVDPDGPEGSNPPVDVWSWEFLADGLIQPVVIQVEADEFPSYAAANGNGLDGDGNANASGSADAVATGISLGDGANTIENRGEIIVRAEAEAAMYVSSDGDAFGDARGTASATATATATGIALGDGDDTVRNGGEIDVMAAPQVQALANVTGGDVCIWFFGWWCGGGGDGVGTANVTLAATAAGITAGGGSNLITNDGSILVVARPGIRNDPRSGEFVADVRQENSQTIGVSFSSRAVGIETGAGDDVVENNGSISVEAWDGIAGGAVSAAGILTGDGDDIVRNLGSLSVLTFQGGVGSAALGIDTGAGDDQVLLGDGSIITGSVSLGEGDDILTLTGTPVIGDAGGALVNADAGAGTDTLLLAGTGSYAGTPLGIERAAKTGAGTYNLPSLDAMQSLAIDEGTLHLPGSYQFDPDGDFSTVIYADGRNGQLDVDGGAGLAGAIAVERRGSRFIADGTRYTLVATGQGVTGSFADTTLPEARPLLTFELEQTASLVDLVANVPSFGTVTANPLYRRVARNLDGLAGRASGAFLDALGSLQSMEGGFDRAFASLSPDANLVTTTGTLANAQQMTLLLQGHLAASRNLYRKAPGVQAVSGGMSFNVASNGASSFGFSSSPRLLMTSYLGDTSGTWQLAANPATEGGYGVPASRPAARSQAWLLGVAAEGDYDASEGYSAFDTDTGGFQAGYDLRLGERWIAGLSYARSDTDVDVDSVSARGSIDSWSGSVYATWFGDGPYLEGGLSWGEQSFDNSRVLVVGDVEGVATSAHDGDAWSAFLGGGVDLALDAWSVEPYVSFYYYHLEEDAFEESGAESLNQVVAARSTDALRGELGGRLSRLQRLGGSVLDWHASLALNYDFGIDDTSISYTYAGAPGTPFTLDDRDLEPSSTVFGAGVAWRGDRSQLSLDYRGQYNGDYDEEYYGAQLSVRF